MSQSKSQNQSSVLKAIVARLDESLAEVKEEFGRKSFEFMEMKQDNNRTVAIETVCTDFNIPGLDHNCPGLEVWRIFYDSHLQEEAAVLNEEGRILEMYAAKGLAVDAWDLKRELIDFRGTSKIEADEEMLEIRKDRDRLISAFNPSWVAKIWAAISAERANLQHSRQEQGKKPPFVPTSDAIENINDRLNAGN